MHRIRASLLLAALPACATSGYDRASSTADRTEAYRADLEHLGDQVALASDALRALSDNPGDSPRSNLETFQTYRREVTNLEDSLERSREVYGSMDGRAERFFGGWTEDSAGITSAELKRSSDARRAALQANYARLAQGQAEVDRSLERFVVELDDLRRYLENDLTAAGIGSVRGTIDAALAHAVALRQELAAQARATAEARDALVPLRDLAPTHQMRETAARVR